MDELWGGRKWRESPLITGDIKDLHDQQETLDRNWVASFKKRVATLGLRYYDDSDPVLCNSKNVSMYHLLFFSHDLAGLNLWKGIKRIEATGQRTFNFTTRVS